VPAESGKSKVYRFKPVMKVAAESMSDLSKRAEVAQWLLLNTMIAKTLVRGDVLALLALLLVALDTGGVF
jgi:hypothetical protein